MIREIIYGLTALSARREILDIRRRHNGLLTKRGRTKYGSEEWNGLTQQLIATESEIDEVEERYFGRKP